MFYFLKFDKEEIMSNFSKNLKKLRYDNGLSQKDMAEKLNISRNTIAGWEVSGREPNLDTLIKISKTFDISYEDLLL